MPFNVATVLQTLQALTRLGLAGFLLFISVFSFAKDTIIYPKQQNITSHQNAYFLQLMQLVMSKTREEFGDYELIPSA